MAIMIEIIEDLGEVEKKLAEAMKNKIPVLKSRLKIGV